MALLPQGSAVPSALVALMVFRAPAWACLLCFTSHKERVRICQIFAGIEGPELEKCEEAFAVAFKGLLDTEISEETCHFLRGPGGGVCTGRFQSAWRAWRTAERDSPREEGWGQT